jgi:hypothetical protein
VAEAAPGDPDYNGGRRQVHALTFPSGYPATVADGDLDGDGVPDSAEEVQPALGVWWVWARAQVVPQDRGRPVQVGHA